MLVDIFVCFQFYGLSNWQLCSSTRISTYTWADRLPPVLLGRWNCKSFRKQVLYINITPLCVHFHEWANFILQIILRLTAQYLISLQSYMPAFIRIEILIWVFQYSANYSYFCPWIILPSLNHLPSNGVTLTNFFETFLNIFITARNVGLTFGSWGYSWSRNPLVLVEFYYN